MRKVVILLGVAMVMLVAAAGVAVAVDKTCANIPCKGTENDDDLSEREGSKRDRILAYQGEDLLDANNWGNDRDKLVGGPDSDRLLSNDGDVRDSVEGGRGSDRCVIDQGDNARSCSVNVQAADFVNPAGFN